MTNKTLNLTVNGKEISIDTNVVSNLQDMAVKLGVLCVILTSEDRDLLELIEIGREIEKPIKLPLEKEQYEEKYVDISVLCIKITHYMDNRKIVEDTNFDDIKNTFVYLTYAIKKYGDFLCLDVEKGTFFYGIQNCIKRMNYFINKDIKNESI